MKLSLYEIIKASGLLKALQGFYSLNRFKYSFFEIAAEEVVLQGNAYYSPEQYMKHHNIKEGMNFE